ncbi:phosphoribosyltransferase [Microbacterium sp. NPDC078428]|uniref:phosphoribosyltransferase n=1 Tax=Microbacterium sp. NPDC078428 TaxID=3364190 RepID=UPI0037C8BBE5
MTSEFEDRRDAGRQLAARLKELRGDDVVVLGLPRGGVPVAAEVAAALGAPLDVILVRKLGVPSAPEVAMGAIGEDGERVLDHHLIAAAGVTAAQVRAAEQRERHALAARAAALRPHSVRVELSGRTAIIVDDGIATGATASAACGVARARGATRVLVAVPVGSADAGRRVHGADDVICLRQPRVFRAVGEHYRRFAQTSDAEVVELLVEARERWVGRSDDSDE